MYLILLGIGLSGFWLLLSGFWSNTLLLSLGLASVLFSVYMAWRIRKSYRLYTNWTFLLRLPSYLRWLLYEIYKANIAVIKNIWFPQVHPISPTVKRLPMMQKTKIGKTIFANSITLTPGTVSFDIKEDGVLVHAIVEEAVVELMDGEMNQKVAQLEQAQ
ncbi:MAG: Na+/H+ antiporter subunit E [bacterium]